MSDTLNWADFVAGVRLHFPVDSPRLGVGRPVPGQTVSYLELQLRQAVTMVQQYVPRYMTGHEAVYEPQDFVREGFASRGTLPPGGEVTDGYLIKLERAADSTTGPEYASRHPLMPYDWKLRMALVHGTACINDGKAKFCVDPEGYTFYVYPTVLDCWRLSFNYNGLRTEFEDEENTPFDEVMTGTVAEYIRAQIARNVNNDQEKYNSIMQPVVGSFWTHLRNLRMTAINRKGL